MPTPELTLTPAEIAQLLPVLSTSDREHLARVIVCVIAGVIEPASLNTCLNRLNRNSSLDRPR